MTIRPEWIADPEIHPRRVETLRVLGRGRAATASLVRITMRDGSVQTAVEKMFRPGWLTRAIYRLSFAAPFAYQHNRHAILAAFYRRRVAAEIIGRSLLPVDVAMSRYVRYDADAGAWVLGSDLVEGRGIRPADRGQINTPEIEQRIDAMLAAGRQLHTAGLTGSVWQIDPSAMVSTANMLWMDQPSGIARHVIVDLESGIPAVLLPRYIRQSVRDRSVPPFDDLNADRLRNHAADQNWSSEAKHDVERLIAADRDWRSSEIAPLRRIDAMTLRQTLNRYADQWLSMADRRGWIDGSPKSSVTWIAIWWAATLPVIGSTLAGILGHAATRALWRSRITDAEVRRRWLSDRYQRSHRRLIEAGRIGPEQTFAPAVTAAMDIAGRAVPAALPAAVQRFVTDPAARRRRCRGVATLLTRPRYQHLVGLSLVRRAIRRWVAEERLTPLAAAGLRRDAADPAIAVYARGLAIHVAIKTLTPVVAPIKYGSLAIFAVTGNPIFLLPMATLPIARTAATLAVASGHRRRTGDRPPVRWAVATGLLPTVGTSAFVVQMAVSHRALSRFLVRDAASQIGRRLPIYGGKDSRTEMFAIALADRLTNPAVRTVETRPVVDHSRRAA